MLALMFVSCCMGWGGSLLVSSGPTTPIDIFIRIVRGWVQGRKGHKISHGSKFTVDMGLRKTWKCRRDSGCVRQFPSRLIGRVP